MNTNILIYLTTCHLPSLIIFLDYTHSVPTNQWICQSPASSLRTKGTWTVFLFPSLSPQQYASSDKIQPTLSVHCPFRKGGGETAQVESISNIHRPCSNARNR